MKTLELKQMEEISGEGCGASIGFAVASVVLLAVFGGPFGWGIVATIALDSGAMAYGCMNATEM